MHNKDKNKDTAPELENKELDVEITCDMEDTATEVETEVEAVPELSEIEVLTEKNNELNDKYLRLMAEYDNFRKRSQKERDEIYPSATATAIAKFLPVLDNFERAAAFPHAADQFGKGFDMIYQSFKDILTSMGVEEIGGEGEAFDPDIHHAVMHVEDESLGENVIAEVLQKGYKMGGRIIRHAMVKTAN